MLNMSYSKNTAADNLNSQTKQKVLCVAFSLHIHGTQFPIVQNSVQNKIRKIGICLTKVVLRKLNEIFFSRGQIVISNHE